MNVDKRTDEGISLSKADHAAFDRDGFLITSHPEILAFKNDLRERLLKVALCIVNSFPEGRALLEAEKFSDLADLVDRAYKIEKDSRITRAIFELFASSCELFGAMDHPVVLSLCRQLGIEVPMVWTTPAIRVDRPGEGRFLSPAHQDIGASYLSPNGLVFWLPLGRLTPETGGIYGLPGSHKDGARAIVRNKDGYWPQRLADNHHWIK